MSTLLFFVIIHQVFSRENRYKIEGHVEGADSREGTSKARRCLGPGTWMAGVQETGSLSCKHRTPTGKPAPSLPPVWGLQWQGLEALAPASNSDSFGCAGRPETAWHLGCERGAESPQRWGQVGGLDQLSQGTMLRPPEGWAPSAPRAAGSGQWHLRPQSLPSASRQHDCSPRQSRKQQKPTRASLTDTNPKRCPPNNA